MTRDPRKPARGRTLLVSLLIALLGAWALTATFGVSLSKRVAGNVYGEVEAWDAWSPAPFVVRADFRYDNPANSGAGTGTFLWVPFWCRCVAYDPSVWACKFF